ncbi:hypothetical protein BS47DRAFT_1363988 [Hydnum rufescens UP504]|uniref:Uncharacterized protein n=1 Tax=Hydnum rufescens UP504 TaxID=1448309 RepID=A0A9P6DQJ0_9AGAM|nr:hypothetical protein BS47DRAFT_1363988 [Hydnum rufescens UP504]
MTVAPTPGPVGTHERDGPHPRLAPTRVLRQNSGDVTVTATLWYTQTPTSTPSSRKLPVALIGGGIGGGIVLCIVAVVLWKWWDRARTRKARDEDPSAVKWRRNMEFYENRQNAKEPTRRLATNAPRGGAASSSNGRTNVRDTKAQLDESNSFQLVSLPNKTDKYSSTLSFNTSDSWEHDSQASPSKPMATYTPTSPSRYPPGFSSPSPPLSSSHDLPSPRTPTSARALLSPSTPNTPNYP